MASLSSALSTCSNIFSYSISSSHSSSPNPSAAVIPLPRSSFVCHSSKKKTNFTDQILDYIEGGPKLRKWYGAPDLLPKDGALVDNEDEIPEGEEIRDAVLVIDGDSDIGQMVLLSLIIKRARIKALVKDKKATVEAFGTYVKKPIAGDRSDQKFLTKALRGVRAVICPSSVGLQLAVYRGSSGIQALMNSNARKIAERDEAAVVASGIPYTIIRAGLLQNSPGGAQGFCFKEDACGGSAHLGSGTDQLSLLFGDLETPGSAAKGKISKEDAALICVEALNAVPEKGLVFEVVNGGIEVSDWKECFASLLKKTYVSTSQLDDSRVGTMKSLANMEEAHRELQNQRRYGWMKKPVSFLFSDQNRQKLSSEIAKDKVL
ncbi:hypothetical protein ACLOJK_025426 [Asimina triloba]